ncbi:FxsA family protein [Thiothrix litoralis]|uniref:FxsA family protein n=1 Tax=Thiothrix litoralis TaxID=2891210 RepID=A0ABX7WXJ7_9GAMM|nr:FxsA family protein [Thiothrix litoralis]QTR47892.1 FxsA family protein [Thiothrix litoralis]
MRRFPVFTVLLLLVPFIELWLLIKVGSAIGAFATILLLILSGVFGMFLLRHQGLVTLAKFQREMQTGQPPAQAGLEGIMLLLSGLLFIIPGFFSDILGLILLLPPTRYLLIKALLKRGVVSATGFQYSQSSRSYNSHDIEGEVVHRDDDTKNSLDRP